MRHMQWVIVIGCLAILGIALGEPVRVQSSVPEDFDSVVILATNSIQIKKQTETGGDVVVNDLPSGPTLGATQLVLEKNVTVGGNIKADSITIKKNATVEGDVFYNSLSNQGAIEGSEVTPLDLPVFTILPIFQTGSPGTDDVVVPANGSEDLPAGSYRDIVVGKEATLNFVGGFYEVRSISAGKGSELTFDLLTEVTVADKLKIEKDSFVGPKTGALVGAEDIVFYVDGINGTGGGLQEKPLAAEVGKNSQIQANIWARNGTLRIEKNTTATGAFLARDVQVEKDVTFELATFFRNRPPVANPDSASTLEDQAVDIAVLANDSDPNQDDLTVNAFPDPPENGIVAVNPDGTVRYTPDADFNGEDSFDYEVCDDGVAPGPLCDTATVTITITPVNDAPSFAKGADQVVDEDTGPQTVPNWATDISPGPANESGQTLTFLVSNDNNDLFSAQPAVDAASGTLSYTPADNANGGAEVSVQLKDDGGTANGGVDTFSQSFTVTVIAVNDPLVTQDDSASTDEDTPVTIDVLANDSDVDNNLVPSSVTVTGGAGNGHTSVNGATGEITYTPDPDFNGDDSFMYEVCNDGTPPSAECSTATVSVTANSVNDLPTADDQEVSTSGAPIIITLTGSDPDASDDLTFSIEDDPTSGSLSGLTQGPPEKPNTATVTYDPEGSDDTDAFTFKVDDGNGGTAIATVTINPPPEEDADPPGVSGIEAKDGNIELIEGTTVVIVLVAAAPVDPEPDAIGDLTFSIVAPPPAGEGTLSGLAVIDPDDPADPIRSAEVTYDPGSFTGSTSFIFKASDLATGTISDTGMVTIIVAAAADPPPITAKDRVVTTTVNTSVEITLTAGPSGGGEGLVAAAQSQGNTLFDDEATFLEQLESPTTFNFETESGFPEADPFSADVIGLFAGIYFDAKTFSSIQATSGVQTMTGNGVGDPTPTFTQAIIDFTGLENKPSAFGFFALDLTDGEVIEVTVDFTYGPDQVFDAQLMLGDPEFTPTFLGVIAEGDMIESLTLRGTEAADRSAVRAWLIDDLTVGTPSGALTFSILSLPFSGTLIDSNENPITCTTVVDPERGETNRCVAPVAIPGDTVTYTPNQGYNGPDGFQFQADDGVVVSTGNVSIIVGVVEGSCETDPSLCDNGRP